jgi:hypothetical protein
MKKLDIKDIFIIILAICLIINIILRQKNKIDYKVDDIEKLNKKNELLTSQNDSLAKVNNTIDVTLKELTKIISVKDSMLYQNTVEIQKLKNKRNEIPKYINTLDGNGVAKSFSDYLNSKGKTNND